MDARILLVHADELVISRFEQAMEPLGSEVLVAPDGLAGLRQVEQVSPDLVVADILLPRLDGLTLLRALRSRADTRETPVVFLSGNLDPDLMMAGLAAGARFYVSVPFVAQDLRYRIRQLLAGRSPGS